jgi:hypothetical protein
MAGDERYRPSMFPTPGLLLQKENARYPDKNHTRDAEMLLPVGMALAVCLMVGSAADDGVVAGSMVLCC